MACWLIVGHGSVGSFVAARLQRTGASVLVLDPAPRVPVDPAHERVEAGVLHHVVDYAVSCVGHSYAETVPALIADAIRPDGVLYDWNSVAPATKAGIRDATVATVIDVALLDSLDSVVERPSLAASGTDVRRHAAVLADHGFDVAIVGEEVGQAARLKYLRSVLMKGLEGLVLEYAAAAALLDPQGVIAASIEGSLGRQAVEFMNLLLATDRLHAARRGQELDDAVGVLAAEGLEFVIAPAAVEMLRRAATSWALPGAPPEDAPYDVLATYLQRTLWTPSASM